MTNEPKTAPLWTLWSVQRPADTNAVYRWRIAPRLICGMELRPEWSEKLHLVGMGCGDPEWWPGFSDWNGYRRSVLDTLEWRIATEKETEGSVSWGGLDLLPSPFTGQPPRVGYRGRWIGAPPYHAEYLTLRSWMVDSSWSSAKEMVDAWNRREAGETYQHGVDQWMRATFDDATRIDVPQRAHRFLEESLELVQAGGCTKAEAHQLVDYTFGRPIGEARQEVGGTMLTLASLCTAIGVSMNAAAEAELARAWTIIEKVRAKNATKPKGSPLPGTAPPESQAHVPAITRQNCIDEQFWH